MTVDIPHAKFNHVTGINAACFDSAVAVGDGINYVVGLLHGIAHIKDATNSGICGSVNGCIAIVNRPKYAAYYVCNVIRVFVRGFMVEWFNGYVAPFFSD